MHWLPARARDNGLFLVYSNGIGVDDQKIRAGNRWTKTRRPELYEPVTVPTGLEQDTRTARFDTKRV